MGDRAQLFLFHRNPSSTMSSVKTLAASLNLFSVSGLYLPQFGPGFDFHHRVDRVLLRLAMAWIQIQAFYVDCGSSVGFLLFDRSYGRKGYFRDRNICSGELCHW